MLTLWRAYRGGGPGLFGGGGGGHLPDAGGAGDQAAVMLDAFAAMSGAAAEIEAERREREKGRR